jgi:hypothetical protein
MKPTTLTRKNVDNMQLRGGSMLGVSLEGAPDLEAIVHKVPHFKHVSICLAPCSNGAT